AFVVRLMKGQPRAGKLCKVLAARLDRSERGGPVDMRLAHAEEVEIRPVEDHQSHRRRFLENHCARYHAITFRRVWHDGETRSQVGLPGARLARRRPHGRPKTTINDVGIAARGMTGLQTMGLSRRPAIPTVTG